MTPKKIAARLDAKKLDQFSKLMHAWNHGPKMSPGMR